MTDDADRHPAEKAMEDRPSLAHLEEAAETCTACELYKNATQTVFGDGSASAKIMLLGEQPGDEEDKQGEPFVGPAGAVLANALKEAAIEKADVYITNVVKHFRWKFGAGKKRLHQKPATRHVQACRPWLEAELALVDPAVVVTLGASASQAILGNDIRVTEDRGEIFEWEGYLVIPTLHPSAALRAPEAEDRRRIREQIVEDLRKAHGLAGGQ
ncbi:MAG: UdgX family uracil-DNA binding protein [Acidimicrobiia bacterium]